ncbi:MAG: hypothetical protein WBG66_03950 [Geitlerinemataceae cyanobacterium]
MSRQTKALEAKFNALTQTIQGLAQRNDTHRPGKPKKESANVDHSQSLSEKRANGIRPYKVVEKSDLKNERIAFFAFTIPERSQLC